MDKNANLLNRFRNLIKDATETDSNDRLTQALVAQNLNILAVRPQAIEEALKHPFVKQLLTKAEKEQAELKSQNGNPASK